MPRNWSKAVPGGSDSIPQQEEFGSDQPTLADVYRVVKERFNQSDNYWDGIKSHFVQQEKRLDELVEMTRGTSQRVASLEPDARQLRLAMEANGQADTKTRECTGSTAKAVQAMHGDSCSANRVDPDPMCCASFGGDSTGPPALPCPRDDVLVGNGAAAPKSCLSSLEMLTNSRRWLTPHRHGHHSDEDHFPPLLLWFCLAEETNPSTSVMYVSYFSSFGLINNQQAPFWPRVIETNRGKIWCLIQEGRQVVPAPARFWDDCGAHCFVGRLSFWSGW